MVAPSLGAIYDQDTGNMGWMQEGMQGARKRTATLANDQASRLRYLHPSLDSHIGSDGPFPAS